MNETPQRRRSALRTLLIILAVAAGLLIYSYGWTVTRINLDEPQEERRLTNVQNALRELLSPNLFTQDYEIARQNAVITMGACPEDLPAEPPVLTGTEPVVAVYPPCGTRGDRIKVYGANFAPNSLSQIRWTPPTGDSRPREILETGRETFTTGPDGTFEVTIEVPSIRGAGAGAEHRVEANVRTPIGAPYLSNTTNEVVARMIETIFLALVATTISIPPSVILSFFAARNLMRPVHSTLGNLLVAVALLPVGAWLGAYYLTRVGSFAFDLGRGQFLQGTGAAVIIFFVASVTASQKLKHFEANDLFTRLRGVFNSVLTAIAAMFVIGLFGGLAVLYGSLFTDGLLRYTSNFIGTVGELIGLTLMPIGAVIGAFTLSGIGSTLTGESLRTVGETASHVIGGLLGIVCGAIVLGVTAVIASQGALLGLLVPVVAGSLGASILPLLYNRLVVARRAVRRPPGYAIDRSSRMLLSLVGAAIVFVLTFAWLRIDRSLIEGLLPSADTTTFLGLTINTYVFRAMLIGGVLGGISGAIAGTRAAFPLGDILYNTTRTILNALRSIEPLIMGLIFVIWVGIGPFAGVLALTLHSIASLGKLYSEQVENIDPGPIEALESTGANRLQTIMYGVVPQIIPPYIAFTMYRWDINVRMSTIIGFVGGGGIGFLLQQQLNLLRYRDAGVAVLAIAIVVSVLDYASASIRERYI
ncbi:MAG: ABC transporter permease subunit [Chloroflexota bacterium]